MEKSALCLFKGYGPISAEWVQNCLNLFRAERINIRKLLFMSEASPSGYSMLEVHFLVPESATPGDAQARLSGARHAFLPLLEKALSTQPWVEQRLLLTEQDG